MALYPEIEPYDHGMLDVGDGNRVYWEVCGNPRGKPAVVLHGGPGSRANAYFRRFFDSGRVPDRAARPARLRAFDAAASAYDTDMSVNTTAHLIADLELLRRHLGIGRWLVWGVSWGSVLGLRYAQTHPEAVSELVLTGVATASDAEVALLTRGLGQFFPEAFETVPGRAARGRAGREPAAAYNRLIESPDQRCGRGRRGPGPTGRRPSPRAAPLRAALRGPGVPHAASPAPSPTTGATATSSARAGDDGVVLRDAPLLKDIPGTLVQGSLDPGNLLGIVWRLHHAWPGSELILIDDVGHNAGAPDMAEALVAATDKYAKG